MTLKEALRANEWHRKNCPKCSNPAKGRTFQDKCDIGFAMWLRYMKLRGISCRYVPIKEGE